MITEITFMNFKGRSAKINPGALTLITGGNTAGKTTVLQALELGISGGISGIGRQNGAIFQLASAPEMAVGVQTETWAMVRKYTQTAKSVKCQTAQKGEPPAWSMIAASDFIAANAGKRLAMLAEHSGADWSVLERAAAAASAEVPGTGYARDKETTPIEWCDGVLENLKDRINGEKGGVRQHEASLGSIAELVASDPTSPPPDTAAEVDAAELALSAATAEVGRLDSLFDAGREAAALLAETSAEKPESPAELADRAQQLAADITAQTEVCRALEQTRRELETIVFRGAVPLPDFPPLTPPARNERCADRLEIISRKMGINRTAQRELQTRIDRLVNPTGGEWFALCQEAERLMSDAQCIMDSVPDEDARRKWNREYCAWGEKVDSATPRDHTSDMDLRASLAKLIEEFHELTADEATVRHWGNVDAITEKRADSTRHNEAIAAAQARLNALLPDLEAARGALERMRGEQRELNATLRNLEAAHKEWALREQLAATVKAGDDAEQQLGSAYDREHAATGRLAHARQAHEAAAPDRLRWAAAKNRAADLTRLRELADKCRERAEDYQKVRDGLAETRDTLYREAYEPVIAILQKISGPVIGGEGFTLDSATSQIGLWKGTQFVPFGALSGAEQLLAVACLQVALAGRTGERVLILDEMSRLDDDHRERFLAMVEQLHGEGFLNQVIVVDLPEATPVYGEKWEVINQQKSL